LDEEQIYSPKNFSLSYYGEVSLATALGSSLNIPAVKLLHDVGPEEFIAFINRLRQEIANTDPDVIVQESQTFNAHNLGLSVGLGTYELSPLEFASLWKVFLTS
jgi:penicillin-binding protein 1C